jgi:hypothetical protein
MTDRKPSFKPRKALGRTVDENWRKAIKVVGNFIRLILHY